MKRMQRMWTMVSAIAALATSLTCGAGVAQAEQTAPAAQNAATASITITGDVKDRTFTAYPLGTYTNAVAADGEVTSVQFDEAKWDNPSIDTAVNNVLSAMTPPQSVPPEYKDNSLAYLASLNETTDGAAIREFAKAMANAGTKPTAAATATGANGSVVLSGLPQGYYLITDNEGAPILVGTDITVNGTQYTRLNGVPLGLAYAKPTSHVPTKTVSGDTNSTVTVGQTVTYRIKATIPGTASYAQYDYAIRDIASQGLTINKDSFEVTIGSNAADPQANPAYTAFTVTSSTDPTTNETTSIIDLGNVKAYAGQTVMITYTAQVNAAAATTNHGIIDNQAAVSINNSTTYDVSKVVQLRTFNINFKKVDPEGIAVPGAQFTISSEGNELDHYLNPKAVTSGSDGQVSFNGLAAGTYTIQETKVPEGYLQNVKPTFTVTVKSDGTMNVVDQDSWGLVNSTTNKGVTTVTVKNVKSVSQLPMTGAAGITLLVVVAALLAAACMLVAMRSRMLKKQLED